MYMKNKISRFRDDRIASLCNLLLRCTSREYYTLVTALLGLGREALDKKVDEWRLEETK